MPIAARSAPSAPAGSTALPWAVLLCTIVVLYARLWPAVTGDMTHYLLDWYATIRREGPVGAFAQPFSNYTPPYLYLLAAASMLDGVVGAISIVKLLSVAGVIALVFAVCHLLRTLEVAQQLHLKAAWVLVLPTVALNAAALGQCDAFWSAACVVAVAEAIRGRSVACLFWCGVGIAFKAQAVFLAPFILSWLIAQRLPFALWGIPGLVYVAAMLPAWLPGWPALDLATVYLRQAEWGPLFISNAANPWALVQQLSPVRGAEFLWIGHLAALVATIVFVRMFATPRLTPVQLLRAAILSSTMLPWLLPKMHERFLFLAEVLSFVLAIVVKDRRSVAVALLIQVATLLAYAQLLGGNPWLAPLGAVFNLVAMALLLDSLRHEDVRGRTGRSPLQPTA